MNAAARGSLTFMVGADSGETFTRAESLLGDIGAKIVHCGAVGTGGAVKICNNMLLAVSVCHAAKHVTLLTFCALISAVQFFVNDEKSLNSSTLAE